MGKQFDQATVKRMLDFARDFDRQHKGWPRLAHSGVDGKFYCYSCESSREHQRQQVRHEADCPYMAFRRFENSLKKED